MNNIEFISDDGRRLLHQHHLDSFDTLWRFEEGNWFEAPNYRRGGWSGVSKTMLTMPDGSLVGLFIKRQENHVYRSWEHWFRPMATFERECRNILAFQQRGIPTVDLVYFGQRMIDGKLRAILMTRELAGYQALDVLLKTKKYSRAMQAKLFADIAKAMQLMHAHQFQHNCLYPKHLFIKENALGQFDVRFIDLEKAKRWSFQRNAVLRDLGTLHRHTDNMSRTDKLRFFLAYRQEKRLSDKSRKMLLKLTKKKVSASTITQIYEVENFSAQFKDAA